MILDERTELADANSVALAAGTTVLGDVIDLSLVNPYDLGIDEDIWLILNVDTSIVTGGVAGTIQFSVVSDALSTLGGGAVASCTLHYQTAALATGAAAAAPLRAGDTIFAIKLPSGTNYERYLGVLVTVGTTTTTAGKVNAFITRNAGKWQAMADAVN